MIQIIRWINEDNTLSLWYRERYGNQPDQRRWGEWEEVQTTTTHPYHLEDEEWPS